MTTPLDTRQQLSRSGELQRQLYGLQRQIAALSEKIDLLQDSARSTTSTQGVKTSRADEKLPRDMVASYFFVVFRMLALLAIQDLYLGPFHSVFQINQFSSCLG